MNKTQKGIIGVVAGVAGFFGIKKLLEAARPVTICIPGDEKCIGLNWCRCSEEGDRWEIITPNDSRCAPPIDTAVLYGSVTDKKTGYPIEGIRVSCNGYSAYSVMDGTYRIEEIPPGEYAVTFSDPQGRYETKVI